MSLPRVLVIAIAIQATPARADEPNAPTGRFEIGAGFDADLGFLGHAAVVQDDLFHTGHGLGLTADISSRWQQFRLEHRADDILGTGLYVRDALFSTHRDRAMFTRDGTGGEVEVGKHLGAHTRAYLRYRAEYVTTELHALAAGGPVVDPGDGWQEMLRAGVVHDTLDAPTLPRHGTRLELYAETGTWRGVGASLDHARDLGPFTLRVHGHADYVQDAPLSARLMHDGHMDIRGYPLDSISPYGDDLEAIGKVDLELPVWPSAGLSVAVFAEAGVRGTQLDLYRSVGASIIWRSPIGPLRFDWAIPLDAADRTPQFLFSVGGGF